MSALVQPPTTVLYRPALHDMHGFCTLGPLGARPSLAQARNGTDREWTLARTETPDGFFFALVLRWKGQVCPDSMDRANRILQSKVGVDKAPWHDPHLLADQLVHVFGGEVLTWSGAR